MITAALLRSGSTMAALFGVVAGPAFDPGRRRRLPLLRATYQSAFFRGRHEGHLRVHTRRQVPIYSINVDGTGIRKLTNSRQDDAQPQWSPDGSMITFTRAVGA